LQCPTPLQGPLSATQNDKNTLHKINKFQKKKKKRQKKYREKVCLPKICLPFLAWNGDIVAPTVN